MSNAFSLSGKHAIITGGTRGIGLAMAKTFVEAGAKVTVCSRKQEGVDSAVAELASDNAQGFAIHVGKADDIDRLIKSSQETYGPVSVLVNNAGTNPYYGPIIESTDPAWDKTMDVNLKGPYMLSREAAKVMIDNGGGSIINIASIAGLKTSPNQGIYCVTKAGLIMLSKVMARELGTKNVRVNCICPGVIKTKLSEAMWEDPKVEQHFAKMKSLGRIGTTDELTGAALYFASDASSFTTGAVLTIDGGMVI